MTKAIILIGNNIDLSSIVVNGKRRKANIEKLIKNTLKRQKEIKKKKYKQEIHNKTKKKEKILKSKELNDRIRAQNLRNKDTIFQSQERMRYKKSKKSPGMMHQSSTQFHKESSKRHKADRDISLGREILKLKKQITFESDDEGVDYRNHDLKYLNTTKVPKAQRADQQQSWTVEQSPPYKKKKNKRIISKRNYMLENESVTPSINIERKKKIK